MKTLETSRLIMRAIKKDDFDAIHSYASCEENIIYMLFDPNDEAATRSFIECAMEFALKNPITVYQFAVVLKENEALIGGCDLHYTGKNEASIGWLLHRDYWGNGYGTELGRELFRFGFEELNLRRITATCHAENTGSSRLMEKIGMRREGLFFDARPPHKKESRPFGDELAYAMLKDEWDVQKEIAYYNALPVTFNGFIDIPKLNDGEIFLICTEKNPGIPEKKRVPEYRFAVCKDGEKIGDIGLRIGYTDGLYYGGQIGYGINESHRGKGYAANACRLLLPVAKAHNMVKLLITNNVTNHASIRVCEKLGARLVRIVRLPEWCELYKEGQRFSNIFEICLS